MRLVRATWLSLGLLAAAPPAVAQQEAAPARGREPLADDGFGQGGFFSLPRSQDDNAELRNAREEIAAGRHAEAVERLHRLLQRDGAGMVGVPLAPGVPPRFRQYLGLRAAVLEALRDLPPEGQAAYEKLALREAGPLLRDAAAGRTEALRLVAEWFPTSAAGRLARTRLGDMALERGAAFAALNEYRAARDALPAAAADDPVLAARIAAASLLAEGAVRGADLPVVRELAPVRGARLAAAEPEGWPAFGGGSPYRAMIPPAGQAQLQHRHEQVRALGFESTRNPMHAIGGLGGIYVNDGQSLWAFEPMSGRVLWRGEGPMVGDPELQGDFENSINQDCLLAAAAGPDVVVAALQVPQEVEGAGQNIVFRQQVDVVRRMPVRRLFGFDRTTGKLLWAHWDTKDGPVTRRFDGHDTAGPPLVHGDVVYVASHDQSGAVAFYLCAYDLHTGENLWRRLLCTSQGEVNMFGNARQEFAGGALTLDGGVLYGTTNLGLCFAVEARDGRVRWLSSYDPIPMPPTQLVHQRSRDVVFGNSPPVVAHGLLVTTPLDSAYALAMDVQTGRLVWRLPYRGATRSGDDVYWLLGALGDEFVFAGLSVVAAKAGPGQGRGLVPETRLVRSAEQLGTADRNAAMIPRGAIAGGRIHFPSPEGLRIFDARGESLGAGSEAEGIAFGNLLLVDGLLVALRQGMLQVFYDRAGLITRAEEAVRTAPEDPAAILHLAGLLRAGLDAELSGPAVQRLEALLRQGLAAATRQGLPPESGVYRRLGEELFRLSLDRALRRGERAPREAIAALREARASAPGATQWLTAQVALLRFLAEDPKELSAELRHMADVHGEVMFAFQGVGRMPVAAYALFRAAQIEPDPRLAIERAHELRERFPEVRAGGEAMREWAERWIAARIAAHGPEVYAALEARAAAELAAAGGDPVRLRRVAGHFPNSAAAGKARLALLDVLLQRSEHAAMLDALRDGGVDAPGVLRRSMAAAERLGNPALARALAARLLRTHGKLPSDYAPDQGSTFDAVVRLPARPAPAVAAPEIPASVLATLPGGRGESSLQILDVVIAAGFAPPPHPPLLVLVEGERLLAFDPSRREQAFARPLFAITPYSLAEQLPPLLCGDTLVLPEIERIRALAVQDGHERWRFDAPEGLVLGVLGVVQGVVQVLGEPRDRSDGRTLFGLEPLSGRLLYRRSLPGSDEAGVPFPGADQLWMLDVPIGDTTLAIQSLDPLTGAVSARMQVAGEVLDALGLRRGAPLRGRLGELQRHSFATPASFLLVVDAQDQDEAPQIVALDPAGQARWQWSGVRGGSLRMAAPHQERVVVVEAAGNVGGRLVVLDQKDGTMRLEQPLRSQSRVLNWQRSSQRNPAPDTILIADYAPRLRVTCFSLDGSVPSFQLEVGSNGDLAIDAPLLAREWLAVPVRSRGERLFLHVLDLKTRQNVLPGTSGPWRRQLRPPLAMRSVGNLVALQSADGIELLGGNGTR
ncbi:MAG: PQQ-binding-like beta-propeller repeat protein [Planctomycetes bacterium]|nr:PQQ-binding-like beta-propeller repeat protein [Planctomycetota bacterium]